MGERKGYALVNATASLSETLLPAFLGEPCPPRTHLSDMLRRLEKQIEKGKVHFLQLVITSWKRSACCSGPRNTRAGL